MKISYIYLQNFKSYREPQKIDFGTDDKYITIIEGQMGHGKSNLLNAFYWCLFAQYWDSDKANLIDDPDPNVVDLFNKGELKDSAKKGQRIDLFVEIEFWDDDQNKYIVKRSQIGHYMRNEWKFERNSGLQLERVDSISGEYKSYGHEEAVGELQTFFPRSLSNYFLFRGENRAQLVKLQGKNEFQQALKELSKIDLFNRSVSHLEYVLDQYRKELAYNAGADIKIEMEDALEKEADAKKAKAEYENTIALLEKTLQEKREDYEHYRNKIKENQEALELKGKVENEEAEIKRLETDLDVVYERRRKELSRKWGTLIVKNLVSKVNERYQKAVNSGFYPPDIRHSLIEKILKDLKCICGRDIKHDSPEYEKIESLKDLETFDQLLHEIEGLIHDVDRVGKLVEEYPEEIKDYDQEERQIKEQIRSKYTIIKGYKSKIGNIDFTLEELQRKQDIAHEDILKTTRKIDETKILITDKEKIISDARVDYEELKARLDKSKLPAIKVDLTEKALSETKELKDVFEDSIYSDLEKYTQENWEVLVYDKLNYDKVLLKRDSMYFDVLDFDGVSSRSIMNTGHSILLVLSFISALVKIAKELWKQEFPLVMDAPLSEIGESALPCALIGFGKVFNQAIVILKDGTVTRSILKKLEGKIGKRYWIELDKNKQHSKVTEITG